MQLSSETAKRVEASRPVLDDTDLLRQYRAGNDEAAIRLIDRHKDCLVNVLFWYTGRHDEQAEAAQRICVAALSAARVAPTPRAFAVVLYETLRNQVEKRKQSRVAGAHPTDDRTAALLAVLQELDEPLRLTFVLCVIGRLTHVEIAAITGVPPWVVKERLNYARQQVYEHLKREGLL